MSAIPFIGISVEDLNIAYSFFAFFASEEVELFIMGDATEFGAVGVEGTDLLPVEREEVQLYYVVGLFVETTHQVYWFAFGQEGCHVRHERMAEGLLRVHAWYVGSDLLGQVSAVYFFLLFLLFLLSAGGGGYSVDWDARFLVLTGRSLQLLFGADLFAGLDRGNRWSGYGDLPDSFYIGGGWLSSFFELGCDGVVVVDEGWRFLFDSITSLCFLCDEGLEGFGEGLDSSLFGEGKWGIFNRFLQLLVVRWVQFLPFSIAFQEGGLAQVLVCDKLLYQGVEGF